MQKLIKIFTVVLVLINLQFAHANDAANPVFEQLKGDLWELGLDFDYSNYEHIIRPINIDESPERESLGEIEEVSRALYL